MTENKNRCVVTGLGMICAIGNNVEEAWDNALKSVSGIYPTTTVDTKDCYANLVAEVRCDELDKIEGGENIDRSAQLCIKAANEALKDAGFDDFANDARVSVIMGSCVGGAVSIEHYYKNNKDANDINKMPISMIASQVAGQCHAGGVVTNIANACAAGTISIAYACDLIRAGKADVVVAGGADAFASVPYAGFLSLQALDEKGCSPFNRCEGITLGEGSGVVIVESYEHATKRNAKMYCEVLGAGVSSDAHHITAPRPDGEGQMNAIRRAIKNSGISAADINYVNAHGTGTAKNDNAEFLSLHAIFDEENDNLSVSSTKAMTGHCLGAAGAIEAVFAIKALTTNTVPPTLGYSESDKVTLAEKAGKIDFVPNEPKEKELTTVMSNSFAFGGNNASIVFSKNAGDVEIPEKKNNICVTGLGIVSPMGNGITNFIEKCEDGVTPETTSVHSVVDASDYNEVELKMSFYRKLDNFCKLQSVSGMYALRDGNFKVTDDNAVDIGIIVGTADGALGTCCNFEDMIAEAGNAAGSAFKFPNTVYNAAGGYLSICSGIKGYNVTVTNGSQSGLSSIAYAMNVLRFGQEKAMLATGTDENTEIINELYTKLGHVGSKVNKPYDAKEGFTLSDGSVSILLEDEEAANARDAKVYCHVAGYGMAHQNVEFGTITGSDEALDAAIASALEDAGMTIDDIDTISGFANGREDVDTLEAKAYARVFGDSLSSKKILAVKEHCGEARAAAATLACAQAALLLSGDMKQEKAAYQLNADLSATKTVVDAKDVKNVLVTAYGFGGSYCAVVLTK